MTSITRHVQHPFYAFHGTVALTMLLALYYVGCGTGHCL